MDAVNNFLIYIDSFLGSALWFPAFLLSVGIFFTLYLGFPQIRYFAHAIGVTTGRFDKQGARGDTSHFQALSTALSGTVGTGNIGGVALALHLGGPAALFWMWMTAFFGMTSKFVEVTLSHKYRTQTEDGTMAGGPMYYMEKCLNMKWLAVLFAAATVLSSFGTGNLPQINSIASGIESTFSLDPLVTASVLSVLLALVIIGGITRIAKVAAAIVPTMAFIYLIGAFAVIIPNVENVVPSFLSIFSNAFTGSAAAGGFLGATFAYAFDRGVNRGLYSNEAGQGSAPIAHAAARTDEPADEGMVSILEPFIDTIVICTITGLVILSSGVWMEKFDNEFQRADMSFVAGSYSDSADDVAALFAYLSGEVPSTDNGSLPADGSLPSSADGSLPADGSSPSSADGSLLADGSSSSVATVAVAYSGPVILQQGVPQNTGAFTLLAARSVAENAVYTKDDVPITGTVMVDDGQLIDTSIAVTGQSLLHSVPLTTRAFTRGLFGEFGQYIVSIGLMLFAFSTAIAWSYYGDRAMIYLFGPNSVLPYRIVYVLGFFTAALVDTTVIWNLSLITIVLMTVPNLVGIMLMRKEMKATVNAYWEKTEHGRHGT